MDSQNPYRAPSADVSIAAIGDDATADLPRRVRARRGASWVVDGFGVFGRGVAGWLLAWLIFAVPYLLQMALTLFAFPTSIAVQWLVPLVIYPLGVVVVGGVMYACHHEPFASRHVVRGIGLRWRRLLILGVQITLLFYLVTALMIGTIYLFVQDSAIFADPAAVSSQELAGAVVALVLAAVIFGTPLFMAVWFAPALVGVTDMRPGRALLRSVQACMINLLPFLLYGLLAIVMLLVGFVLMAFVMGIVIGLTSAFAELDTTTSFMHPTFVVLFGMYFALLFVLGSVIWASQYLGFRDIFLDPPPADA